MQQIFSNKLGVNYEKSRVSSTIMICLTPNRFTKKIVIRVPPKIAVRFGIWLGKVRVLLLRSPLCVPTWKYGQLLVLFEKQPERTTRSVPVCQLWTKPCSDYQIFPIQSLRTFIFFYSSFPYNIFSSRFYFAQTIKNFCTKYFFFLF